MVDVLVARIPKTEVQAEYPYNPFPFEYMVRAYDFEVTKLYRDGNAWKLRVSFVANGGIPYTHFVLVFKHPVTEQLFAEIPMRGTDYGWIHCWLE